MKHPPIKDFVAEEYPTGNITQWFAENRALYSTRVCIEGAPCHSSMTCPVGKGCLIGHNGIDIVAPWGTLIFAVDDGIITDVKDSPTGYGKHLRLVTQEGVEWTYGHASENLVVAGQRVKAGHVIQKMGNTGFVVSGATPFWKYNPYAGTHLHFGKRFVGKDYLNGFFGSIDFREELENVSEATSLKKTRMLTLISLMNKLLELLRLRK